MPRIHSKEQLLSLASECRSIGEIARRLGYASSKGSKMPGGVYKYIRGKLDDWGIDTSHFVGRGWAKGRSRATDQGIAKQATAKELPDELVFCKNSRISNQAIYRRLVREGKEEKCDCCGIIDWLGKLLRLQLDHTNGVNDDNRRKNLRFLCPNCHSQTPTYSRGKVVPVA